MWQSWQVETLSLLPPNCGAYTPLGELYALISHSLNVRSIGNIEYGEKSGAASSNVFGWYLPFASTVYTGLLTSWQVPQRFASGWNGENQNWCVASASLNGPRFPLSESAMYIPLAE